MHTADLYIGRVINPPAYCPVLPEERQTMLEATRSEQVKAQRFYAWDTLLKGLFHSRGLDADEAALTRTENGKWVSAKCGTSISHCKTAVAAAISEGAVGVDIEPFEDARYREALLFRIATETERDLFPMLSVGQRIAALWTRKEAAFKRGDRDLPTPIEADAADPTVRSIVIRIDGVPYVVSVAAEQETLLRVFEARGESVAERTNFEVLQPFDFA